MLAAAAESGSGDQLAGRCGGDRDRACSTPFFSAPSSPAHDAPPLTGGFFSAPASPARHGGGGGGGGGGQGGAGKEEYGCDFEFDFFSSFPSPAPAAMSSADELFHNGQIRPMRLASFLLRPQAAPPTVGDVPAGYPRVEQEAARDERGRLRSRSVHRRSRSNSPFRTHWLSPPSPSPAPASRASGSEEAAAPSASRSSSSSSTASSASYSSSRSSRRWRFLKELLHRGSSDGGKNPPPAVPKTRDPSPAAAVARGRGGGRRRSAHERLYAARRTEVEEMRRRTFLPYQQGLLFGCLGLSSRGCGGAMRGLSAAAAAKSRS